MSSFQREENRIAKMRFRYENLWYKNIIKVEDFHYVEDVVHLLNLSLRKHIYLIGTRAADPNTPFMPVFPDTPLLIVMDPSIDTALMHCWDLLHLKFGCESEEPILHKGLNHCIYGVVSCRMICASCGVGIMADFAQSPNDLFRSMMYSDEWSQLKISCHRIKNYLRNTMETPVFSNLVSAHMMCLMSYPFFIPSPKSIFEGFSSRDSNLLLNDEDSSKKFSADYSDYHTAKTSFEFNNNLCYTDPLMAIDGEEMFKQVSKDVEFMLLSQDSIEKTINHFSVLPYIRMVFMHISTSSFEIWKSLSNKQKLSYFTRNWADYERIETRYKEIYKFTSNFYEKNIRIKRQEERMNYQLKPLSDLALITVDEWFECLPHSSSAEDLNHFIIEYIKENRCPIEIMHIYNKDYEILCNNLKLQQNKFKGRYYAKGNNLIYTDN